MQAVQASVSANAINMSGEQCMSLTYDIICHTTLLNETDCVNGTWQNTTGTCYFTDYTRDQCVTLGYDVLVTLVMHFLTQQKCEELSVSECKNCTADSCFSNCYVSPWRPCNSESECISAGEGHMGSMLTSRRSLWK